MLIKKRKRSSNAFRWTAVMAAITAVIFLVINFSEEMESPLLVEAESVMSTKEASLIQEIREDTAVELSSSLNDENGSFRVFIGVKTSERGVHGQRLPQIYKTWLKDALREPRIDIRFFTEPHSRNSDPVEGQENLDDMEALLVPSPGCADLLCKTGAMFRYFLEHTITSRSKGQVPPAFFCNFDDDNYVLIQNLLRVLKSYHDQGERNLYIGSESNPGGHRLNEKYNNTLVHFLTGGAGYCISRELFEGSDQLPTIRRLGQLIPDDIAVGYVIQEMVGGKLVRNDLFHSHIETGLKGRLPKEKIAKQVSFGFNNKLLDRPFAASAFPDIPIEYSAEEDPLLFRSFHHYLSQLGKTN